MVLVYIKHPFNFRISYHLTWGQKMFSGTPQNEKKTDFLKSGIWLPQGYLWKCSIPLSWNNANSFKILFETCVKLILRKSTHILYPIGNWLTLIVLNLLLEFFNKNLIVYFCSLVFGYFHEVSDGHSGQLHPIIVKLL